MSVITESDSAGHSENHSGHHEAPEVISRRDRMGVLLLIFADAAFLGALIFTWFYLRTLNQSGNWIPKEVEVASTSQSWTVTGVAIVSAAFMYMSLVAVRQGRIKQVLNYALLATIAMAADIYLQFWALDSYPFELKNGGYASTMYAIAATNIFHLILTTYLGVGIVNRIRQNRYSAHDHGHIREVTYWWIWVAAASFITSIATMYPY